MPIGDDKHQLIFNELVNILGPGYVSDDPAVIEAYNRESQTPAFLVRQAGVHCVAGKHR